MSRSDTPLAGPMSREEFEARNAPPPEEPLVVPPAVEAEPLVVPPAVEEAPPKPTMRDAIMRLVEVIHIANQLIYDDEAQSGDMRDGLWSVAELSRQALDILSVSKEP